MKAVVLGSSSGKPTKTRCVSAVAIVREGAWILMDCGENAQVQMLRAGLHPGRLDAVFITHMHGDHINGLPGLLATLGVDCRERGLTIAGPHGIGDYLNVLRRLKVFNSQYPIDLKEMSHSQNAESGANVESLNDQPLDQDAAEMQRIVFEARDYIVRSLPLKHVVPSFGYRIEERPKPGRFELEHAYRLGIPEGPLFSRLQAGHTVVLPDGRSIHPSEVLGEPRPGKVIAYCLDTRPCKAAIELAKGADLLIHEGTFAAGYEQEASEYGHSTSVQAAGIAREAGVKKLVLTHISPRFTEFTGILDEACSLFPDTLIAEDLMTIEI